MDTSEQILVIILSSFLALFLLLAIIAIIMLLQLLFKVRKLVAKAERVADSAEAVSEVIRKTVGPLSVLRIIRGVADLATHRQTKEK